MKKLSITYRATIDRYVPIEVKQRAEKKRKAEKGIFFFIRERVRHA